MTVVGHVKVETTDVIQNPILLKFLPSQELSKS